MNGVFDGGGIFTQRCLGWSCGYCPLIPLNAYQSVIPISPRSSCSGWSLKSAHSNAEFLQSIDWDNLDKPCWALTLTLLTCPETHTEWAALRNRLLCYMRSIGITDYHWVVEWQRRKVPHIHMVVLSDVSVRPILSHWCSITDGAMQCQTARLIYKKSGWAAYLAKHGVKTASNYQRSDVGIPPAWGGRTGRLWGCSRGWRLCVAYRFILEYDAYIEFKRRLKKLQKSRGYVNKNMNSFGQSAWGNLFFLLEGLIVIDNETGWEYRFSNSKEFSDNSYFVKFG